MTGFTYDEMRKQDFCNKLSSPDNDFLISVFLMENIIYIRSVLG